MNTVMERPSLNMKAVEMAAASPDERVRGVAQRRLEIERELSNLDGFLSFYIDEAATVPVPPPPPPPRSPQSQPERPRARHPAGKKGNGTRVMGPNENTARLLAVVAELAIANGRPIMLEALHEAISQRDDINRIKIGSLLERLLHYKHVIRRVSDKGFWPVGVDLPKP
jgi:hypothetical protein